MKKLQVLKKEIEGSIRRWNDLPCSYTGKINIVKMVILPKTAYIFIAIPMKIPNYSSQILKGKFLDSNGHTNISGNFELNKRTA